MAEKSKKLEIKKKEELKKKAEETRQKFEEAMDDDFNTSLAVSALFNLAREVNKFIDIHTEIEGRTKRKIVKIMKSLLEDVLGVQLEEYKPEGERLVKDLMEMIFEMRESARERGDWETADEIRKKLKKIGLVIEYTPEGTKWKIKQLKS